MRLRPLLLYGGAYLLLTLAGQLSLQPGNSLPFLWPAAGITVTWCLRARGRRELWAALGLITVLTAGWFPFFGSGVATTVLLTAGTIGIAVLPRLVVALLRHTTLPIAPAPFVLRRPVDFLVLAAGTLTGGLASAIAVSGATWAATGVLSWTQLLGWLLGNSVGAFTVAATVLAVLGARRTDPKLRPREARVRTVERVAVFLTAIALTLVIFAPGQRLTLTFLLLVVVVWAGMRLRPAEAAVLGLLLVLASVVLVRFFAGGPFALISPPAVQVIVLQAYAGVAFGVALVISLVAAERDELAARLIVSEQAAREDTARLRAVTDNTSEAIIVVDREGRHLFRNPVADRLISAIDVDGEDNQRLALGRMYGLDGTLLDWPEMPVVRAFGGETVREFPVRHKAFGASRIWAIDSVPLNRDANGVPDQILVLVRDITSEQQRLEQLETFAATVAHDLQGPIAGVIGWAETGVDQLAADGPQLRTEIGSTLARIQRSARRAQGLINDLLGYASARTAPVSPAPLDLDELVDGLIQELLERHPDPDARIGRDRLGRVQADAALMRQVLGNLLGNALKYAHPERSARVHVGATRRDGELVLTVSDNGIGVPRDQRELIFDAFHRVTGAGTASGTGLGLAICAQAVARHGGTIVVTDRPDGPGSSFVVTLPDQQRTGTPTASVR